jgi:hypothetical protein
VLDRFKRETIRWRPTGTPFDEYVTGVTHNNSNGSSRQTLLRSCRPGTRVEIVREPTNAFDKNALALFVSGRGQIGYIPAESAAWMAPLIDTGAADFSCLITSVEAFEATDGRPMLGGRIAITRLEPSARQELVAGLLVGAAAAGAATTASRALSSAGRVFGAAIATADATLLRFAQGSRVFALIYWLILATVLGLGLVAAVIMR